MTPLSAAYRNEDRRSGCRKTKHQPSGQGQGLTARGTRGGVHLGSSSTDSVSGLQIRHLSGTRSITTMKKVQTGPKNRDKNHHASLLRPLDSARMSASVNHPTIDHGAGSLALLGS